MTNLTHSPEFPMDVSPVNPGVYRVKMKHGVLTWSKFDGRKWCECSQYYENAATYQGPSRWALNGTLVSWFGTAEGATACGK